MTHDPAGPAIPVFPRVWRQRFKYQLDGARNMRVPVGPKHPIEATVEFWALVLRCQAVVRDRLGHLLACFDELAECRLKSGSGVSISLARTLNDGRSICVDDRCVSSA
ncbi:hypothetical protein [Hyphomicrobium sp. 1Nfss2.1]|uniref:hypothetical protein n=1 Tax=Hyphomicrobium sp. 1Nfss2.1 TaxID=3413936 RepID=UPI003C7BA3A1